MHILCPESLKSYNTLALSAEASALVRVTHMKQLLEALEWAGQRELPVIPLGQGSNVVIAENLQALVLCMATSGRKVLQECDSEVFLRVSAGENWHQLVEWTLGQGYYGLENLALIPGTVGAAPIQNIGAYGVELDSMIAAVHAVSTSNNERVSLSPKECEFAYRDSVFKRRLRDQFIITSVDLKLSKQPQLHTRYPALSQYLSHNAVTEPCARDVFEAVVSIRSNRLPDPAVEHNAGSFFKNPVVSADKAAKLQDVFPGLPAYEQDNGDVKLPAAWLIEACGWKGKRQGDVGVHPGHALVVVNYGDATGKELLAFTSQISQSVRERFDVSLEIEPRVYGLAS